MSYNYSKGINNLDDCRLLNTDELRLPIVTTTNRGTTFAEIYKLLKEYDDLGKDYSQSSPSTKNLIANRMDMISRELLDNYLVLKMSEVQIKKGK